MGLPGMIVIGSVFPSIVADVDAGHSDLACGEGIRGPWIAEDRGLWQRPPMWCSTSPTSAVRRSGLHHERDLTLGLEIESCDG